MYLLELDPTDERLEQLRTRMVASDLFTQDGSPGYDGPSPEKFDLTDFGLQNLEKQDGELFTIDSQE